MAQLTQETMTDADVGRLVTYVPGHADGDKAHPDAERGRVMHWNNAGVMVDYIRNQCRTDYADLYFDDSDEPTETN